MKNKAFLYATAFVVAMIVFHLICAATGNDVTTNGWRIDAFILESVIIIILQYCYHFSKTDKDVAKALAVLLILNSTFLILYLSNQKIDTLIITTINIFAIVIGSYIFFKKHD